MLKLLLNSVKQPLNNDTMISRRTLFVLINVPDGLHRTRTMLLLPKNIGALGLRVRVIAVKARSVLLGLPMLDRYQPRVTMQVLLIAVRP